MERISRLSLPMMSPEDVIVHLGKGKFHWKAGFSAQALATSWFAANAVPARVQTVLDTSPAFSHSTLVDAFLERAVNLRDGKRPSQTDLLAILRVGEELAVAAVEGKVDETFGPLIGDWLAEKPTHADRLRGLCSILNVAAADNALRYQLFHRSASAVLEAERYCARKAILLVHSFSTKKSGFTDFAAYLGVLGMGDDIEQGRVYGPIKCGRIELYAGWVIDECCTSADPVQFWEQLSGFASRQRASADDLIAWINERRNAPT